MNVTTQITNAQVALGASMKIIDSLLEQIGLMQGMVDDQYGVIAAAVEQAKAGLTTIGAVKETLERSGVPSVVVECGNGVVHSVQSNGVQVMLIDFGTGDVAAGTTKCRSLENDGTVAYEMDVGITLYPANTTPYLAEVVKTRFAHYAATQGAEC